LASEPGIHAIGNVRKAHILVALEHIDRAIVFALQNRIDAVVEIGGHSRPVACNRFGISRVHAHIDIADADILIALKK